MKIRNGRYGLYQGKEYRITKNRQGIIKAVIDDTSHPMPVGFSELKSPYGNKYYKIIQKEDLEEVYRIATYVIYMGRKRGIAGQGNGVIHLMGFHDEMDKGFKPHGKGEYIKDNIPIEEIEEFIEEKEPYNIDLL